jgi:integrase/recombinase XerD
MPESGRNIAGLFNQLQLTLFNAGRLSTWRRPSEHQPVAVTGWEQGTPALADTCRRYLEQVTVSLRPNTVKHIEHDLRRFGTWLTSSQPDVTSCADLTREHIEAFKTWLVTAPTRRTGKPLNRVSVKNTLINLHCFFDRITEWGYPNAPGRPLLFIGDLPIIDKPLPRFLDDGAATKVLRAAGADPDPLSRLIVELLARTGIRRGELLNLTVDAVVQIGSAYWLRIAIGKLHNDRYVPLHPELKLLLDDWVRDHRPQRIRTDRLLVEHHRPISSHRVTAALDRHSEHAGIGHVTARTDSTRPDRESPLGRRKETQLVWESAATGRFRLSTSPAGEPYPPGGHAAFPGTQPDSWPRPMVLSRQLSNVGCQAAATVGG